jgi:YHS domain-containing protein
VKIGAVPEPALSPFDEDLLAMKAVTRRRWGLGSVVALTLSFALQPSFAAKPGQSSFGTLPGGLPDLPALGEAMQRDLRSGLAIGGFDPVAYHATGRATPGRAAHEIVHDGIVWRFASAANLAAFEDAPAVYAPAFAGFDATGVAAGRAVETDPRAFAVVGARLYLFRTPANRSAFIADPGLLPQAEQQWREVYATIAR